MNGEQGGGSVVGASSSSDVPAPIFLVTTSEPEYQGDLPCYWTPLPISLSDWDAQQILFAYSPIGSSCRRDFSYLLSWGVPLEAVEVMTVEEEIQLFADVQLACLGKDKIS
jgi:hypothetical protein